ncbi:outer membrane protein assembly factor BamB family protein [Streptomyces kroppenstedtii]|uniref:outer membrane protein assembly factor BamB family protein n=1 Tax=Streptomyces kroppenstedtii TaxID=3051181 RepID=UPI0028D15EF3|nr:PQQ-binding-like beta-propeller repeat protein [Streptomyces sp. DSM 40484]
MSQPPPPPPPNQPPQGGGFGAPQDPPPGGFGPPTPPAGPPQQPQQPQPGYGYPQAPPSQPPSQTPPPAGPPAAPQGPPQQPYGYPQGPPQPPTAPGYGYPGQQPPQGYGYPGQQPPYGYPQPHTMPMQPQAPQGGKKFSAQAVIIVAAVLAIGLIVGAGVWYASSSGKDDKDTSAGPGGTDGGKDGDSGGDGSGGGGGSEKVPSDTSAKVLFQLPAPEVPKKDVWSVEGSWLTDKVYAKAGVRKIVGHDPDTGKETWTLPLTGLTCAGSPEVTKDGVAVVVAEDAKRTKADPYPSCTEVTAFNVDTGKALWTKSVAPGGGEKAKFKEASISGTTVAVGSGLDGGAAFDISNGKVLWQPKVGTCEDVGYAGGEQLVAVRKCGTYGNESFEVQRLDPKTGTVKWSYKLPSGIDNAKVISTKPVVFGVDSGDGPDAITASGATDIFSLDDSGKLRTKITLQDGKYEHDCGVNKVHNCRSIAVGNDRLYVPTKQHEGTEKYSRVNEIVSFSLATGKSTSDRADAGDGYEIWPVRMDGTDIIAYKNGPYDKGSQVVSIDGKTFKETKLLETPATDQVRSAISGMVPKSSEMLYADGRLFMGEDLVSAPYSKDDKDYVAIGFGAE